MQGVDISQATLLAGLVFANAAGILGAYVSIRVSIAEMRVKVDTLIKDVDALGDKIRELEKTKKGDFNA